MSNEKKTKGSNKKESKSNNGKKLLIPLSIIGVAIILIVVLFVTLDGMKTGSSENSVALDFYGKEDLDPLTEDLLDDPNYQNIIKPEDLETKINSGKPTTVYFYSPSCPYCITTTPIIEPIADDLGIDLVQYNLLEFEQGWGNYNLQVIPTVVQYVNGEELGRVEGQQSEEDFQKWFSEAQSESQSLYNPQ